MNKIYLIKREKISKTFDRNVRFYVSTKNIVTYIVILFIILNIIKWGLERC